MNAPERQALTVTELNTLAKEYLENLPLFRSVASRASCPTSRCTARGTFIFQSRTRARPSPP
ncbi:MAG: hypothetical protein ACLUFV_06065 [Acutalibacteraceae bacterium]